jgi:hypothetical protein
VNLKRLLKVRGKMIGIAAKLLTGLREKHDAAS